MAYIRTLERHPLLSVGDGRFLRVEQHVVAFGSGKQVADWGWVITPDFINVAPVLADGRLLCFRQEKYAAVGLTLGLPGGYLEEGEEPLAAAQRELLEETGYGGGRWKALGSFVVDGNRGVGHGHLFLAQDVEWRQAVNADDLEELEAVYLTPREVLDALQAGEFQVMPWATCAALALLEILYSSPSSPGAAAAGS
jgi:ADP-ribose pyrophosphatase